MKVEDGARRRWKVPASCALMSALLASCGTSEPVINKAATGEPAANLHPIARASFSKSAEAVGSGRLAFARSSFVSEEMMFEV